MQAAEALGDVGTYLDAAVDVAEIDLDVRGRRDRAIATLQTALARHPLEKMPALNRPYPRLIRFYARAGDRETARRLLREYEAGVPEGIQRGDPFRHGAYGELALAERRFEDAVSEFRKISAELAACVMCGQFPLGQTFDQMGAPDSARAAYERAVNSPHLFRIMGDAFGLAASYKRLGELHEARGDRKTAADYYGKLLDLWKDADAELQPALTEVRQRMAALATEPGT
jgi:tetratricopeptide (TPR) repeat protein